MPRPPLTLKITNKHSDYGASRLIKDIIRAKKGPYVKVGYPKEARPAFQPHFSEEAGKAEKTLTKIGKAFTGHWAGGTTVLDVAVAHEFGTTKLPERSFIRAGINANLGNYKNLTKKLLNKVAKGETDMIQALNRIGLQIVNDIKTHIRLKKIAPPSKRALKEAGTTLWDTGQLINTLAYSISIDGKSPVMPIASALTGSSGAFATEAAKLSLLYFGPIGKVAAAGLTLAEEQIFETVSIEEVINPI